MKTTLRSLLFSFVMAAASTSALAGAYDDLITAAYRDDTGTVMDLVNRGMDVNSVDPAGNTLLHIAARSGNDELIAALLKQKANPNPRNRVGETPLMLAAYNGKLAAADALLAGGAQLDIEGWTPLQYAVFAEQPEMVAYLLGKGPKINARAPNQQTALMLAAKNGNLAIAKQLLDAKADSSLKDQNGETALTLAQSNNNSDIVHLIEQPSTPVKVAPVAVKPISKPARPAPTPAAAPVPAKATPIEDLDGPYVPPPFQSEK